MAIYKYFPYILKPLFEVTDQVMRDIAIWDTNDTPYENGDFYQILMEERLSVDESLSNKFSFIYLSGIHTPWQTNSDGTFSETETTLSERAEGVAVVMQEYVSF